MKVGHLLTVPTNAASKQEYLCDAPFCVVITRDSRWTECRHLSDLLYADWLRIGGNCAASATITQSFEMNELSAPEAKVGRYSILGAIKLI